MTADLIDFGIATICFANSIQLSPTHAFKGSSGTFLQDMDQADCIATKSDVRAMKIELAKMGG